MRKFAPILFGLCLSPGGVHCAIEHDTSNQHYNRHRPTKRSKPPSPPSNAPGSATPPSNAPESVTIDHNEWLHNESDLWWMSPSLLLVPSHRSDSPTQIPTEKNPTAIPANLFTVIPELSENQFSDMDKLGNNETVNEDLKELLITLIEKDSNLEEEGQLIKDIIKDVIARQSQQIDSQGRHHSNKDITAGSIASRQENSEMGGQKSSKSPKSPKSPKAGSSKSPKSKSAKSSSSKSPKAPKSSSSKGPGSSTAGSITSQWGNFKSSKSPKSPKAGSSKSPKSAKQGKSSKSPKSPKSPKSSSSKSPKAKSSSSKAPKSSKAMLESSTRFSSNNIPTSIENVRGRPQEEKKSKHSSKKDEKILDAIMNRAIPTNIPTLGDSIYGPKNLETREPSLNTMGARNKSSKDQPILNDLILSTVPSIVSKGPKTSNKSRKIGKAGEDARTYVDFICNRSEEQFKNLDGVGNYLPALQFIMHRDTRVLCPGKDPWEDQQIVQRYNLASIFLKTHGKRWRDPSDWLSKKEGCNWKGITCNGDGIVVEINLSTQGLSGKIPSELSNFPSLEVLDLFSNSLTGTLPKSILSLASLGEPCFQRFFAMPTIIFNFFLFLLTFFILQKYWM